MRTNNTFTLIFFIRKSRSNTQKLSIYSRITVDSERSKISLKRNVSVYNWDSSKERTKGSTQNIRILNEYLDLVYEQIRLS